MVSGKLKLLVRSQPVRRPIHLQHDLCLRRVTRDVTQYPTPYPSTAALLVLVLSLHDLFA